MTFPTRRPFPLFLGQRAKYRDFVGRNVCEKKDTLRECDIVPSAVNGTFPLPILMLESVLDGDSGALGITPPPPTPHPTIPPALSFLLEKIV